MAAAAGESDAGSSPLSLPPICGSCRVRPCQNARACPLRSDDLLAAPAGRYADGHRSCTKVCASCGCFRLRCLRKEPTIVDGMPRWARLGSGHVCKVICEGGYRTLHRATVCCCCNCAAVRWAARAGALQSTGAAPAFMSLYFKHALKLRSHQHRCTGLYVL